MVAVDNLDVLTADEFGGSKNEPGFERPFRGRNVKWQAEVARDFREFPAVRPRQPGVMAELAQTVDKLDALIIRTPAAKQRVEMKDTE